MARWVPLSAGRTAAVRCYHSAARETPPPRIAPPVGSAPRPFPSALLCRYGHPAGSGPGLRVSVSAFLPPSPLLCSGSRIAPLLPSVLRQPLRPLTYCSLRKGKRKSVKAVVKRFLRLHNGLWVRRKSGYKKKLWKKSTAQKKRLREFVLCNGTQCKLLDKMTTSFWRRRNWYVDDPYQKYHDRTNLSV
ncbi:UNVERIFIED_CONTAM: hypothetical protein H355_005225 [Colinus virginianus]|nr:hypothetical protein H355_005225 [Colinus virginianus]